MLSLAGIAPYGADGLDWFAGMAPSGVAALGTAAAVVGIGRTGEGGRAVARLDTVLNRWRPPRLAPRRAGDPATLTRPSASL